MNEDVKTCLSVCITEEQIQKHSILCEEAIRKNQSQKMVDNTASIARYGSAYIQWLEFWFGWVCSWG